MVKHLGGDCKGAAPLLPFAEKILYLMIGNFFTFLVKNRKLTRLLRGEKKTILKLLAGDSGGRAPLLKKILYFIYTVTQ